MTCVDRLSTCALLVISACSSNPSSPSGTSSGDGGSSAAATGASSAAGTGSGASSSSGGSGDAPGIASKYPGDVGIDKDAAVVWAENFEEGSIAAVTARYDDKKNQAGMSLVPDVPGKSGGKASIKWPAGGGGPSATDVYKQLPDHDELYARWYVKYQKGITWHHTGVWIGGYNPASKYPSPQAGLKPDGDDRFSVSLEPVFGIGGASPRLDFYNYWMQMHSWMTQPMGDMAYYGNALVHQNSFTVDEDQWMCIEVHIKLNTDPTSAAGGVLSVWKNNALVQHYDDKGAVGYWIRDKFCPMGADGKECTDYPPDPSVPLAPLNLQYRSSSALKLNAFWPQNYITEGPEGSVQYDDMVVATERVGCLE
jgi:hypothetical protein